MKRILTAVIAVFVLIVPACAYAEENYDAQTVESIYEGTESILNELDLAQLEELYGQTVFAEEYDFSTLLQEISQNGLSVLTVEDVLEAFLAQLKKSFGKSIVYIAEIAAVLLITGVLKQLPSEGKGAAKIAAWTGYIISGGIAVSLLIDCFAQVRSALDILFRVVEVLTPVLMVLLTGMGGLSGSSVMSPIMAALTGGVFEIVERALFPLLIAGAVLGMGASISSAIRLDKLSDFAASLVKWALGIIFTIFIGVCAMKGIAGATIDGVYFKTAKYTIDRMVPVIGGMFSDTLDTIMACSMLVKNSVGILGLMILGALMLAPIVSLFSAMMLFRAGAAVVQPFSDESSVKLLERMGKTAELAFLVVLTCMAMAFISIALMMGAVDMSMMMR